MVGHPVMPDYSAAFASDVPLMIIKWGSMTSGLRGGIISLQSICAWLQSMAVQDWWQCQRIQAKTDGRRRHPFYCGNNVYTTQSICWI